MYDNIHALLHMFKCNCTFRTESSVYIYFRSIRYSINELNCIHFTCPNTLIFIININK